LFPLRLGQGEELFCPVISYICNSTALREGSQASPPCRSSKFRPSIKINVSIM